MIVEVAWLDFLTAKSAINLHAVYDFWGGVNPEHVLLQALRLEGSPTD